MTIDLKMLLIFKLGWNSFWSSEIRYSFLTKVAQEIDSTSSFNFSTNCFLLINLIYHSPIEVVRPLEHELHGIVYNLSKFFLITSCRGKGANSCGRTYALGFVIFISAKGTICSSLKLLQRPWRNKYLKISKVAKQWRGNKWVECAYAIIINGEKKRKERKLQPSVVCNNYTGIHISGNVRKNAKILRPHVC